jgi:glutaminyl-peptide cyclotransferase
MSPRFLALPVLVSVLACGAAPAADQRPAAPAKTQAPAKSQTPAKSAPQAQATFDSSKAWDHLRQMVAIGPRPSGSAAIRVTRAYITRQLSAVGLTVQEQAFRAMTPRGPVDMVNLIVKLPGRRADRILLTGHYDTKLYTNITFVGASDGASSGAILIELARVLNTRPREFTYEFVWFDGEEAVCEGWTECQVAGGPDNTYGSRHYVQAAKSANALSSIKAMILFDMIGAKDLRLKRDGSSTPWLVDAFWAAARRLGHTSTFVNDTTLISGDDHYPFKEAGIPVIDLIDIDDYPQWHTKDDDMAHVAAGSLQIVGDVAVAAMPDIERRLAAGR